MSTRRRSIARTLRVSLLGLTIVLAVIGAIGIAALYDARQEYEDTLSLTSALEVASANMLASAVALEANLAQPPTAQLTPFVSRAAAGLDRSGARVRVLAGEDRASRALSRRMSGARYAARALALRPSSPVARERAASRIAAVRDATRALAARQVVRRDAARAEAKRSTRAALVAIAFGVGLALVAVLALLALLVRNLRRPLDELVDATHRMASGDLAARVDADGPRELAALGESFNIMGADLALASRRAESQRQRLETTIQSLGDGLVICDAGGIVVATNPRATQLIPLRAGAAAHAPGSPLPPLAEALAGEVTVERDGVTMAVTAARLAGPEAGVVWTLRDITERARLEQAKSDFVATASHELRSPLTSIKGFIELLQTTENDNLTERQVEFIKIALQSTDRLVDLVNDLLDIARIESGEYEIQPRSVDLRETIEEVAALMAPRLQDKSQRLVVEIAEPRPAARADPARVRQIVTNLLTNAHQYTDRHGTITLRLDADPRSTRIVVGDSGRGMTPEDVEHVFDRFYRGASSDRRTPGTGLGLPIVRSLVELHGGAIDVRSDIGVGTTFTISLPSVAGSAPSPAPAASRLAARRVLIVDDEPALAALIASQLKPLGLQTVQVHSGREALERLRAEHFDAMTLDVLMPEMSGFQVLEAVRADPRLQSLPVIFVSVSSTLPQLNGEWAVAKPIDRRRLSDVLHSAIQTNRSRVLVVAPDELRIQIAPALAGLGVQYRWESSPESAARAGADELFEVALVHESRSAALRLLESAALRGRRGDRSVILFATGDEQAGLSNGVGMPVFPLAQAIDALRTALGSEIGAASGR